MIGRRNLEILANDTKAPSEFIWGCRMRRLKEVDEKVLEEGRVRMLGGRRNVFT